MDTPRRAGASVAEADDPNIDQARPLFEIRPRPLALFADGPSRLTNIASWRVKETDRIAAMTTELRKFGAVVDEGPDYLRIQPPAPPARPQDPRR